MVSAEPRYVHGTTPREQERLSRMNDLLNAAACREMALGKGERILDLGAGLGQLTRAMARAAGPAGHVLGIESSEAQIGQARQLAAAAGETDLVELRLGDAGAPPLRAEEWGSFDLAHTRFLLEHLTDPLAAVRVLVRAVRPGGRIVLQDEDHDTLRLDPEPFEVVRLWRAYVRSYELEGKDPYIGRRLPALLVAAGARVTRTAWLHFGGAHGEERFPPLVENMARVLESAQDAIVGRGLLDRPTFLAGVAALRQWGERPGAALWHGVIYVEAQRP